MAQPAIRRAGRELLSLALMDARNRTLQLMAPFEDALAGGAAESDWALHPGAERPWWIAGHIAWLAEYWIGRNPQRGLGRACPAGGLRLASIEPMADRWFEPRLATREGRWAAGLPSPASLRAWMLETLEGTLELLEKAPQTDDGLYFFRMALLHEDLRGEQLAQVAQVLQLPLALAAPAGCVAREPLQVPAATWRLGVEAGGFAFDVERPAHDVAVPEFEIDAQPVTWSQYSEFVGDGAYDREELWSPQGWQWLQSQAAADGRRGPRFVEEIGSASGAVLQSHFGKVVRRAGNEPAMHVSGWEAEAYARWAGRRLPTEVEWEMAAHVAARRGFTWGGVSEWTAGTLRPWHGFEADAWTLGTDFEAAPHVGRARIVRGASFAASTRLHDARLRRWAQPARDDLFVGFRTCAF